MGEKPLYGVINQFPQLQYSFSLLHKNSKLRELTVEELKCWNDKLIHDIFERGEAIKICSFKLKRSWEQGCTE